MNSSGITHPLTGIVVPVSALKSRHGAGIGEFADLVPFGRWAASAGVELIQLLPVNDTGFERSPYSALSAFALHPIYARLDDFPEARDAAPASRIAQLKSETATAERVDFDAVLSAKISIVRSMWDRSTRKDREDAAAWGAENPWVRPYALYSLLKDENDRKPWTEWPRHRDPSEVDLKRLWRKRRSDAAFHVWLQWHLDRQFRSAAEELKALGVLLKGDIPILINDDSADVWARRENFRLDFRAGSPPDAGSPDGQNWGFPTYDWNYLESTGYQWWRERLERAAVFYDAYRIDHVLGFFRIWCIPETDRSARCGFFDPSAPILRGDLERLGWDSGRIVWMSRAHIPGEELRDALGEDAERAAEMLHQVENEDLWRADADSPTEEELAGTALDPSARERLAEFLRNRTLLELSDGTFRPNWSYEATRGWASLDDEDRRALDGLLKRKAVESEGLWDRTGRERLTMMKGDGSMLVCAEDLGSIPDCVPPALDDLGILGLRVCRWAREWNEPGEPYIRPSDYPELSVATASVHDSTTLRDWLAKEAADDSALREVLDLPADADLGGTRGVRTVLEALQRSASLLAVHPLQDLLALDASCVDADPAAERFNTPGTVGGSNWTWRMKPTIEDLPTLAKLNAELRALCEIRTQAGAP